MNVNIIKARRKIMNFDIKLTNYAEAVNRAENLGNKRCL